MTDQLKPVYRWLITGCFLIACMVIIGGITRLTESGLSITEWNVVKGTIPPLSEKAWQDEFSKYQSTTEFQEVNYGMDLDGFKQIYFWEYFHRLWGRMMGLVFIIPFIIFWRKGLLRGWVMKRSLFILLGGALVGSLGWFMVMSGLKDRTDVSHYRLAIHLCAAFALFVYVLWTALNIKFDHRKNTHQAFTTLKQLGVLMFAVLFIQIIYGAFTAGMNAATIYNTWPLMNGEFMPDNVTALDSFFENFTNHKDGVQFVHRWFAFVVVLVFGVIWWKAQSVSITPSQQKALYFMLGALLLQFTLGVVTLLLSKGNVPVWIGVLHQAGALVLLTAVTIFNHRIRKSFVA